MEMMELLRHRVNLYRRYPYWKREGVIFVHVPKAAGTSINRALYGRTLGHYTASEIKAKFPKLYCKSFVFSMVRNPWDRVLSAYRFACIGRTDVMGIHNPSQYQIPEFKSFERFVCEWLPKQKIESLDFVFQPQWWFVCNQSRELLVDHLGYVESMEDTVSILSRRLNKNIVIGNENTTRQKVDKGFQKAYSKPEMVDIVRSIYSADAEIFGYDFE